MRTRTFAILVIVSLHGAMPLGRSPGAPPADDGEVDGDVVAGFVRAHCLDCHSGDEAEEGLALDRLDLDPNDRDRFLVWSLVHDRLAKGEMPPADAAQPSDDERAAVVAALAARLRVADRARQASEGRNTIRRLNRVEYHNTLREVLALPNLALLGRLPPDGAAHGFDKSSAALDFSHVHVMRWMEVADSALGRARASTLHRPESRVVRASLAGLDEVERTSRGFLAQVRQQRVLPMVGLEIDPTLESSENDFANQTVEEVVDPPPHFDGLAMFIHGESNLGMEIKPFRIEHPGRYKLRVHGFGMATDRGELQPSDRVETVGFYTDDRTLGYCDLPPYEPTTAELEVWLEPGDAIKPLVATSSYSVIRIGRGQGTGSRLRGNGICFQWFELEGPLYDDWPPESHRRLFGEVPMVPAPRADDATTRRRRNDPPSTVEPYVLQPQSPREDAERLIRTFAARAIRRPVAEADLEVPLAIATTKLDAGESFEDALLAAYRAILCSPAVVLLHEDVGPLDDYALASRLSYFLSASPPDDELRRLAAEGRLSDPEVLREQTDRLLDDPKLERFVAHFLDHWMWLAYIDVTQPDENLYPEYTPMLLDAMLAETRGYFAAMIREDLPARYVVDSDFTFANQPLAELYDIEGVSGSATRRIDLPPDAHRGGLITQAAVMKVTANGTTTSPVLRGVFVMSNVLGDPPPPPPPSVPAVEPDVSGATTIREQLAKHREIEACAGCHRKIDPPGFALESFDVMGGYRERYRSLEIGDRIEGLLVRGGRPADVRESLPVDAAGEMPGGQTFAGIDDFRTLLVERESGIAENLLRNLVTYATGTPVGFADEAEFQTLLDEVANEGHGTRAMIHAVVRSRMFRNK